MIRGFAKVSLLLIALPWLAPIANMQGASPARSFRITLSPDAAAAPISGRLYVFLTQRERGRPIDGPNWFHPEPFFRVDVHDIAPGATQIVDDAAAGFPDVLSQIPVGTYRIQAILDHDFFHQHHARGVGNLYSDVLSIKLDSARQSTAELQLTHVIEPEPFPETESLHEVVVPSRLLSQFHDREVIDRWAVLLPPSYHEHPERRYPTIYTIPGFGGTHRQALGWIRRSAAIEEGAIKEGADEEDAVEFIRVMLNGDCKWGHHVYADSATNGPRATALVREMIPCLESQYRCLAEPTARFLAGHSSGGWSSLWLQIAFPEFFAGVWSTSPDPVDFRDYQQVNLYAEPAESLYFDEDGQPRPIARLGDRPVIRYVDFGKLDDVLGRGGQLRSFEAVFSPLDDDGLPRRLWDRRTGRIDPTTARAWQAYDIHLVLLQSWPRRQGELRGKLHIVTGSLDTFYLEGAVEQLASALAGLGSDAEIDVVEGADHRSVLTPELRRKTAGQMTAAFLAHHRRP